MGELATYNKKRDFGITAEPPGKEEKSQAGNLYLIQKHAASRLHYDFRLELDGVLLSWAVTKGPSLDPADKRLAVRTEDHPVAYGSFEGIIPKGEYGGGTVMLWDTGGWEPLGDPQKMLKKGHLEFTLTGERLHGRWHLIRMQNKKGEKRENWLLVKGDDEYAEPGQGMKLVEEIDTSAVSGRSMEEIAAAPAVWRSGVKETAKELKKAVEKKGRQEKLPDFIPPALATLVQEAPEGTDWLHEIKYDGYRAQARLSKQQARIFTRSGLDWTAKFPAISEACATLPAKEAVLDGEIVVLGEGGVTSFKALKDTIGGDDSAMLYYVFDLLHLDGKDLRGLPLTERKALLETLLKDAPPAIRYSDHIAGQGPAFYAKACQTGLEGIISKKASAKYMSGKRDPAWRKVKCSKRQEFVIIGYEKSERQRHGLRALLLGFYEDGALVYTGKVGTGFSHDVADDIMAKLKKLEVKANPVPKAPRAEVRSAVWVKPELVAEVEYFERTEDGRLRHPSFQGLREDKKASEITLETPAHAPHPTSPLEGGGGVQSAQEGGGAQRKTKKITSKPRKKSPPKDSYGGVPLSSPDKVLYPEQGITKQDMAEYYEAVLDLMLPHVLDRPISLVRCPMGRAKKCFFQRHRGEGDPHLADTPVAIKGRIEQYMYMPDASAIFQMVQMGALELHLWGSHADKPLHPDRLVIDLDPGPDVPFRQVIDAAKETRQRLADLGLESFVKTTGGKGLHVVFPIARRLTWDEAKPFTKAFAQSMEADSPKLFVTNMRKDLRGGKIFIDYLRNDITASAIAPYSTRSRPGAPVAAPLFWKELDDGLSGGDAYNVQTMPGRLAGLKSDPWAEMGSIRQSVTQAIRKKLGMKV